MPGFHINEMGEIVVGAIEEIGVVDVYELASDIGKECEKIIEKFGADSVTNLMPVVINTLELLEAVTAKTERDNTTIQELTEKIQKLEGDKIEKAEYRKRFEQEIEAIEEQWRQETQELVDLVANLQNENKRILKQQDDVHSGSVHSSGIGDSLSESGNFMSVSTIELLNEITNDSNVLQRLKDQLHKQREEIKSKTEEIEESRNIIDTTNIQIERLKTSNADLRRRYKSIQDQIKILYEERADFLAQLQDQQHEIHVLRKRLGLAKKENEDLVHSYEEDDPSKPRYTTAELKDLLGEREKLLSTIDNLTEELNSLKQEEKLGCESEEDEKKDDEQEEEDPPVQGPMPYEPDDAPWKRSSESGIRRFFRKLFSESEERSLSTLSKMTLASNTKK
ncbi:RILPL1 family protein [Megaselia abdita]